MKIFRISNLLTLALAVFFGSLLFRTSQSVQLAEDKLAGLSASYERERESIRVLETEWDYLNRPQNLEALAHQYLDLAPASGGIVADIADIPEPAVPALPRVKPAYAPQPVSLRASAPAPSRPAPSVAVSSQKSFESVLKDLTEGRAR